MADRVYQNDTAILVSHLLDADDNSLIPISGANWKLVSPSDRDIVVSSTAVEGELGDRIVVTEENIPFSNAWDIFEWNGTEWDIIGANVPPSIENDEATFIVSDLLTSELGLYKGSVQFTTSDNVKVTKPVYFEVLDPLDRKDSTGFGQVVDLTWVKLEDLFDSELGGPWLRDKTLRNLDKEKVSELGAYALYYINGTYQPATNYSTESFPYSEHSPLLAQALLVEVINHLIRSYVEQPNPIGGGNITWLDRRDYTARWKEVLDLEKSTLNEWLDLFKKGLLGLGTTAILIGGYAGWPGRYPRYMRGRNPYIVRYW